MKEKLKSTNYKELFDIATKAVVENAKPIAIGVGIVTAVGVATTVVCKKELGKKDEKEEE